jgi:hypothetical protein
LRSHVSTLGIACACGRGGWGRNVTDRTNFGYSLSASGRAS